MSARTMTRPGGQGAGSDVDLVVQELQHWPPQTLSLIESQGTKIVVCRNSVVDYRTDLRGVGPRGWPPGAVWDTVPGAFLPDRNEVVIGVIGHADRNPHVPRRGEGHGSWNLVVHESGHAFDLAVATHRSSSAAFTQARTADLATLSAYERQPDPAGSQETWAESAARYYGTDPGDTGSHPNLHMFWLSATLAILQDALRDLQRAVDQLKAIMGPPVVGTARMNADSTIRVDLIATDDKGAHGDAQLIYTPEHALYSSLLSHLGGNLRPDTRTHFPQWPGNTAVA
jgi:hypothetical protein